MKSFRWLIAMGIFLGISVSEGYAGDKWVKRAPFPEPSEELVGASVGEEFYVCGGFIAHH